MCPEWDGFEMSNYDEHRDEDLGDVLNLLAEYRVKYKDLDPQATIMMCLSFTSRR